MIKKLETKKPKEKKDQEIPSPRPCHNRNITLSNQNMPSDFTLTKQFLTVMERIFDITRVG